MSYCNNACLTAFTKKVSLEVEYLFQTVRHPSSFTKQVKTKTKNENPLVKRVDKRGAVEIWDETNIDDTILNTILSSNLSEYMKHELKDKMNNAIEKDGITGVEMEA